VLFRRVRKRQLAVALECLGSHGFVPSGYGA
jgi:hypothetical protein